MQLGIFAKTFDGKKPSGVLAQVKAAGFGVAQYNMACSGLPSLPDAVGDADVAAIAEAVKESGVALAALSATFNMIHPDVTVRDAGLRRLEVLARVAKTLSIPLLTLCTGTRNADDMWRHHDANTSREAWRDLVASMEKALAIAEQHDVALGIEPELANVVNSAAKAQQLIAEMASPRLRVVFDPANLFEEEPVEQQRRIVREGLELLADRIAIAHAKDRLPDGRFVAAGQGVLDYPHFLRGLRNAGFDGPLITHGLLADEAPGVARFLAQALV
ncbi:MAG: sugar phosphate isomerase/epimerase [Hyphomicrobiales bacterium]